MEKYGVENPQQNEEIFIKQQKSAYKTKIFEDTNLHYQGSYELDFLEKYNDKINIENGPTIKIEYNKRNKVYYPDFYLPEYNLIVEIKSHYTYNKNIEINLTKQKNCLEQGYNYLFVIDKDYNKLEKIII